MKKNLLYIIPLVIAVLLSACKKDEEVQISSLTLENLEISVAYTAVDIKVDVCSKATINEVLFQYTTDSAFKECREARMVKVDKTEHRHAVSLDSLLEGTKYYFRCKALNKVSSCTSRQDTFTTKQIVAPTAGSISITDVSYTSAVCVAEILSDGGNKISDRGVCYSKNENPTISDTKVQSGVGIGSFTSNLTNLTAGTTYYVRAYASNDKGTVYSEQLSFTTPSYGMPTVITSAATNISYTTATCGGNVTTDGGQTVTARGVCYSTTQNPTIYNNKKQSGSGTGSFTCNLTGLSAGTTYYVRAYATNSKGTSYGQQVSFKTTAYGKPTVTTSAATNISYTTATCSGNVTADGDQTVTARGVCYATTQNPTTSNSKVTGGSGTGSFTCNLTGLTAGTTYYVRAYATNSKGTSYGTQVTFTTNAYGLPTVTTSAVSNISYTSATCGGNVSLDGGQSITSRGICYSTFQNPTISSNKVVSGSETGSFTCNLTGLIDGTTYFVRAYATNSIGTSYGSQVTFTTLSATGAIISEFSVSATKKVFFSKGNLQYQASTNTWRFAENQYDIAGENNSHISSSYSGWIDLFGWGTGINPTKTNRIPDEYTPFTDWGNNKISNGGNTTNTWRTLTKDEWNYLLNTRPNCENLRGPASVHGQDGYVILPDNWVLPANTTFTTNSNSYSIEQWSRMEENGAIFLPFGGYRLEKLIYTNNSGYWTSTGGTDGYSAYFLLVMSSGSTICGQARDYGRSVRLVRDVN